MEGEGGSVCVEEVAMGLVTRVPVPELLFLGPSYVERRHRHDLLRLGVTHIVNATVEVPLSKHRRTVSSHPFLNALGCCCCCCCCSYLCMCVCLRALCSHVHAYIFLCECACVCAFVGLHAYVYMDMCVYSIL